MSSDIRFVASDYKSIAHLHISLVLFRSQITTNYLNMKFVIVLACLLAVACAVDERSAVTTEERVQVNPDGFNYNVETSNGIELNQQGKVDEHTNSVSGSYKYTAPDGSLVVVTYTADENGYKADVKV
ncbi:larval cuticle protein 9 [Drosophila nasuta]|nr:larval cuticle protein 9 [Drosophila nasuta]